MVKIKNKKLQRSEAVGLIWEWVGVTEMEYVIEGGKGGGKHPAGS